MKPHIFRFLSCALILLASVESNGAEALRWKFKPGDKVSYQITQILDSKADAGTAGEFDATIEQISDISWHVEEISADGNARIRQTFDRVQLKVSTPDGHDSKFDSGSEELPVGHAARFATLFHALADSKFGLELSPRGKLLEVRVPSQFFDAMRIVSTGALDELATEESIKQMISALTVEFPEESLEVNDEWETKIESSAPILGKMTVVTTYQFLGNKEIDGQSLAAIKPTVAMQPASEPDAKVEMQFENQSTTGEIYFDREAGRLHSGQVEQTTKANFSVKGKQVEGTIRRVSEFQIKPSR